MTRSQTTRLTQVTGPVSQSAGRIRWPVAAGKGICRDGSRSLRRAGSGAETSGAALDDAFSRALAEVMVKLTGQRSPLGQSGRAGGDRQCHTAGQSVSGRRRRVAACAVRSGWRCVVAWMPPTCRSGPDERPETLVMLVPGEDASVPDAHLPLTCSSCSIPRPVADCRLPCCSRRTASRVLPRIRWQSRRPRRPGSGPTWYSSDVARRSRVVAAWRWTLLDGAERSEWQGDADAGRAPCRRPACGPLCRCGSGQQPAATRGTGRRQFCRLRASAGLSARCRRDREPEHDAACSGDSIVYDLVVRGSADQLRDALALKSVLVPVAPADGVGMS